MIDHKIIEPTVGRVVHFHIAGIAPPGFTTNPSNTYKADVAAVLSARLVNLLVVDSDGKPWPMQNIPLRQPEDEAPLGNYCEWMPYQKGQAARTEQLEKQLAGDRTPLASGETQVTHMGTLKLHEPGRIGAVDTLRIAAKGLDLIATELATGLTPVAQIQEKLRPLPPLLTAVIDSFSKPAGEPPEVHRMSELLVPMVAPPPIPGHFRYETLVMPPAPELPPVDADLYRMKLRPYQERMRNEVMQAFKRGSDSEQPPIVIDSLTQITSEEHHAPKRRPASFAFEKPRRMGKPSGSKLARKAARGKL